MCLVQSLEHAGYGLVEGVEASVELFGDIGTGCSHFRAGGVDLALQQLQGSAEVCEYLVVDRSVLQILSLREQRLDALAEGFEVEGALFGEGFLTVSLFNLLCDAGNLLLNLLYINGE